MVLVSRFRPAPSLLATLLALVATPVSAQAPNSDPIPVTAFNFARAESDLYFTRFVKDGAFGKLVHVREPAPIEKQDVVRMNRDTLYSSGVFDLDAAPVSVTLPDAGERYMALQVVSEDQYTIDVLYAPTRVTITKEMVGTRYVALLVRTLANPLSKDDLRSANALQDAITVEQARQGRFEVPGWDPVSQKKARDALLALQSLGGVENQFGRRDEVDPVAFLIGAAAGWGGNPRGAAIYSSVTPKQNDGKTVHRLTVRDVPVEGFWSISRYDAAGYFEKNDLDAYSVNDLTAKRGADGSVTVQFGGCEKETPNCLPISPGWNYTVRMYRPRKALLDGSWTFPAAQPVN